MFTPPLYTPRFDRAPSEMDAWVRLEAKSATTANDLRLEVAALEARADRRRRATRHTMLLLSACAAAAIGCLM